MVDQDAFSEARPSQRIDLLSNEKFFRVGSQQHLKMTEEEFMLCGGHVAGYSLQKKKWGWFNVDSIRDVVFNARAWNSLIFKETHKTMLLSLVKVHVDEGSQFDDVIRGKGKGLVVLLHGPPGTGKTLTAGELSLIATPVASF